MTTFLGIAAATWGLVMAVAPLLQIRRMIIRRSSGDLSLGYFAILLPGFVLWAAYGWAGADWPLVVPNVLALAVGVTAVVVGRLLRSRDGRSRSGDLDGRSHDRRPRSGGEADGRLRG